MPLNNSAIESTEENQVIVHDLEKLLRKSINDELSLVDYKTTQLVAKGENYSSTLLKVDAVIKRSKNSPEEKLALAAKMITQLDFQKENFKSTVAFRKEIFIFEKLISAYRELEREAGVRDEDLINVLPNYFGGRLSLNSSDRADENAVLLMENLKIRDFHTMDRMTGMSFDHAQLALKELARYHALGIALKQKRPNFFNEAKSLMEYPYNLDPEHLMRTKNAIVELIVKEARFKKYEDRIKKSTDLFSTDVEAIEPWVTLSHGDFWTNNIMFREENDKVKDVKFVDFQIALTCSPLLDVLFFIFTSCLSNVVEKYFDELLNIYHKRFNEELIQLACDVGPFARKNFDEQLKRDAFKLLYHCFFALKIYTLEINPDDTLENPEEILQLNYGSDMFFERCWVCVSKYLDKKWI